MEGGKGNNPESDNCRLKRKKKGEREGRLLISEREGDTLQEEQELVKES